MSIRKEYLQIIKESSTFLDNLDIQESQDLDDEKEGVDQEKVEEFMNLAKKHDITHDMSDDWSKAKKGKVELSILRGLFRDASPATQKEMEKQYNEMIDSKIRYNPEQFYWESK